MNKLIILSLIVVNTIFLCLMISFLDQPLKNESTICPIVEYRYTKNYWEPDIISFFICWLGSIVSNVIMILYIVNNKEEKK